MQWQLPPNYSPKSAQVPREWMNVIPLIRAQVCLKRCSSAPREMNVSRLLSPLKRERSPPVGERRDNQYKVNFCLAEGYVVVIECCIGWDDVFRPDWEKVRSKEPARSILCPKVTKLGNPTVTTSSNEFWVRNSGCACHSVRPKTAWKKNWLGPRVRSRSCCSFAKSQKTQGHRRLQMGRRLQCLLLCRF